MILKVCREFDDATLAGKLFHVRAAATGNARSPTVDSHVDVHCLVVGLGLGLDLVSGWSVVMHVFTLLSVVIVALPTSDGEFFMRSL